MGPNPTIPRYRILRELGRGGMGRVDLVHDREREGVVARKRVLHASPDALRRLKREFRLLEPLRHPNVVRLFELDEDADGAFFTMEFVDGRDAFTYCQKSSTTAARGSLGIAAKVGSTSLAIAPTLRDVATGTPSPDGALTLAPDAHAHTEHALPATATTTATSPDVELTPRRRRGSCPTDLQRVLTVLHQLLDALDALHGFGIVHGDIKPSNVLVRADGALKVLDFGALADLESRAGTVEPHIVGTPAYMSPEQLRGHGLTPASDLYALGAMLFELLTGEPPANAYEKARRGTPRAAPSMESFPEDVPAPLARICAALLEPEAARRPGTAEVRLSLATADSLAGVASQKRSSHARGRSVTPVGRAREMGALTGQLGLARDGAPRMVALLGPAGAGKSALLSWFEASAEAAGYWVLRGQARAGDRTPFNALDGAIDHLAALLGREHATLGQSVRAARARVATTFPALAVEGTRQTRSGSRAEACVALLALLTELARTRPLMISIDDLHAADADSLAVLEFLTTPPPSRVLFAFALREEDGAASRSFVLKRDGLLRVPIAPFGAHDLEALALHWARGHDLELDGAEASALVATCQGNAVLLDLMLRSRSIAQAPIDSMDDAVVTLLGATTPLEHRIVALLVASDEPISRGLLQGVLESSHNVVEDALHALEETGLARHVGGVGAAAQYELTHKLMRDAATRAVSSESVRAAHADLARTLEERGDARAGSAAVVRHLALAGEHERARRLAFAAAREADERGAFRLSSTLYALAMDAPGAPRFEIARARAWSLERAGAYLEAARAWREVAAIAVDNAYRTDARYAEAQCLLGANELEAALRCLEEAEAGNDAPLGWLPGAARVRRALDVARFLAGPRRVDAAPRANASHGAVERARRRVDVAEGMLYFRPRAGLSRLISARREALALGAIEQAARCDLLCAHAAELASSDPERSGLAARYVRRAEAILERVASPDPLITGSRRLLASVGALRRGDWDAAAGAAEDAVRLVEEAGQTGTRGHLYALLTRFRVDLYRQDAFGIEYQAARMRAVSHDALDATLRCPVRLAECHGLESRGDLEAALALTQELYDTWPRKTFQFGVIMTSLAFRLALCGRLREAMEVCDELLTGSSESRPRLGFNAGVAFGTLALVEALALCAGVPGASAARARRHARKALAAPPFGIGRALRALAHLELHAGNAALARGLLLDADERALELGQRIDAGIARVCHARLGPESRRAALEASARALLREAGASERLLGDGNYPDAST